MHWATCSKSFFFLFFPYKWVYNVLDGKAESERVVYNDPDPLSGFMLLPDMKWDCSDLQNLYILAVVHRRDLFSLRDLTADHLPLLKNILNKGKVNSNRIIISQRHKLFTAIHNSYLVYM